MTTNDLAYALADLIGGESLLDSDGAEHDVESVRTFDDAHLVTQDDGVLVAVAGRVFQLSIVDATPSS